MIIFRVDGNQNIGMGHVMRCLSIAKELRKLGRQCIFVLADNRVQKYIEEEGFLCKVLNSDYQDLDSEVELICKLISNLRPSCLVIDSYYVTKEYLNKIRTNLRIVYIDDRAEFAYPVDVLINYNIFASELDYLQLYQSEQVELPQLFIGCEYVPLREEFRNIQPKMLSSDVRNVLVSTGGADKEHIALEFIKYLLNNPSYLNQFTFHFIIGAMNQDRTQIERLASDQTNIILHKNVTKMAELMMSCDIAISAAGSTLYELCACGIPTITYVIADNQIPAEKEFVSRDLMISVGDYRKQDCFFKNLYKAIAVLAEDKNLFSKIQDKMSLTSPNNGAYKIALIVTS